LSTNLCRGYWAENEEYHDLFKMKNGAWLEVKNSGVRLMMEEIAGCFLKVFSRKLRTEGLCQPIGCSKFL
jgi:hypothetical protein